MGRFKNIDFKITEQTWRYKRPTYDNNATVTEVTIHNNGGQTFDKDMVMWYCEKYVGLVDRTSKSTLKLSKVDDNTYRFIQVTPREYF